MLGVLRALRMGKGAISIAELWPRRAPAHPISQGDAHKRGRQPPWAGESLRITSSERGGLGEWQSQRNAKCVNLVHAAHFCPPWTHTHQSNQQRHHVSEHPLVRSRINTVNNTSNTSNKPACWTFLTLQAASQSVLWTRVGQWWPFTASHRRASKGPCSQLLRWKQPEKEGLGRH